MCEVSLPHATVLRPCVMWGNEEAKVSTNGSVPYRLATHNLEYMFRDWARKYVHVSDVVEAVKLCLYNQPRGTFDLAPDHFWTNQQLAELVEWKDYQWIDNPQEVGFKYISSHANRDELPTPPGWAPKILMEEELPRLGKGTKLNPSANLREKINRTRRSRCISRQSLSILENRPTEPLTQLIYTKKIGGDLGMKTKKREWEYDSDRKPRKR